MLFSSPRAPLSTDGPSHSPAPSHKRPRPRRLRRIIGGTAVGGALALTPLALANAPAEAASSVWDRVAACESGGNWSISTGNGFYGGLQFTHSTWQAYGGGAYAYNANGASRLQQIAIAQRTLRSQGPGAWPVCSWRAGLTMANGLASSGGGAVAAPHAAASRSRALPVTPRHADPKPAAPRHAAPRPVAAPQAAAPRTADRPDYTVVRGDTLSRLAARFHIPGGWQAIWNKNRATIHNPNLIYVGQRLDVR